MGNDMFNDEQLAHAEIVQKETEEALGFWKERALKAEAKLADKYLIEEQYETACGDRDGLLRMVETLREQKYAAESERDRLRERLDQFEAYDITVDSALRDRERLAAAESRAERLAEALREIAGDGCAQARIERESTGTRTYWCPDRWPHHDGGAKWCWGCIARRVLAEVGK